MKNKFIILYAIFLVILPAVLYAQQNISWSLALVKDNQSIPFSKPVETKDGDTFSIVVTVNQACHVYLIVQDSGEQMYVLANQRFMAGQRYETPMFKIVPPAGTENFYIIVSHNEQKELDNAIKAFENQANIRNRRNLLNAVLAVRRSASAFKENPEKPVSMGGAFRGAPAAAELTGTEYGGSPVYVKNIIINH